MEICKEMELRRAGYSVMFVILLCALAIASSEGRRKTIEMVLGNGGGCRFTSSELDRDTDEQACMKELAERENAAQEFVPRIPIEQIHEAVRILPPNRRQEFLDCLRKKIALARASEGRPSSIHLFIKSVQLIFGRPNIPRRHLISHSHSLHAHHSAARAPLQASPSPASSPSSSSSNAPSPFAASPANSPISNLHPHVKAPSPANSPSSNLHPHVKAPSPANSPSPNLHPHVKAPSPPASHVPSSPHPSKKHDDSRMAMIAAIVAAAVGVVAAFALLLFCCRNGVNNKIGPKDGIRDERPLLVSLSELSADSSQKSYSLGNSTTKELTADNGNKPSLLGNLSMNPENGTSKDGAPPAALSLKPPPGRSDPQPPPPATAPPPTPPAPRAPPPPPMKVARPPPVPPGAVPGKSKPLPPHRRGPSASSVDGDSGSQKTRLKPFFWDKVLASPDQSMVWHEISAGSFQ